MKFEITYSVKGLMNVFKDVVEASNVDEAEVELKKLVSQFVGNKEVRIVLVKSI